MASAADLAVTLPFLARCSGSTILSHRLNALQACGKPGFAARTRARPGRRTAFVLRASAETGTQSAVDATSSPEGSASLRLALEKKEPVAVASALDAMKEAGTAKQWRSYSNVARRATSVRELSQMGIKNPDNLAVASTRNEAAFLASVVIPTSLLAVLAAAVLPGDWGFFTSYLIGSISFVVLGVGSVAPGLLKSPITLFAPAFSDYKERVLKHEAAHFLVAYLVGVPVCSYSLDIGQEHTNLIDDKLQRRIYEGRLEAGELDKLAAVSMAGLAAEGLNYEEVMGQTADLVSLQRLINRSKPVISPEQQLNLTRWAVLYASSLIKSNSKAFDALVEAMRQGAPVDQCIAAIESA